MEESARKRKWKRREEEENKKNVCEPGERTNG
jgi:hypothetical protein